MKRIFFTLFFIAALIFSATFSSCKSKKSSDVKLLEQLISDNGTEWRFEYDSKNRIIKTYDYRNGELYLTKTVTYGKNNNVITLTVKYADEESRRMNEEKKFVRNRNTITVDDYRKQIYVNDDGWLVGEKDPQPIEDGLYSYEQYEYKDGNLISYAVFLGHEKGDGKDVIRYEYDNRNSPFRNVATPPWLMREILGVHTGLVNNLTRSLPEFTRIDYYDTYEYSYEYDNEGFPVKQITKAVLYFGGEVEKHTITTRYIYSGETAKGLADNDINSDENVDINDELSDDDDLNSEADVHTIYFNNEEITVYAFLSPNSDGELDMDSLTFMYDGKKQTLRFYGTEKITNYIPGRGYYPGAGDYNFDGYMDIFIESDTGGDNMYYDIYLYDPQQKRYFHHKELSDMTGIQTDEETQTITMYSVGDVEGQTYSKYNYKWEGEELVLFYKEDRNYDFDIEKYILIIQSLHQNDEWVVLKTDTISAGDLWY